MSADILAWAKSIKALTPVTEVVSKSLRLNSLPSALPSLAKASRRCAKVACADLSLRLAGVPRTRLAPPVTVCTTPALVEPSAKASIDLSSTSFWVYSPPRLAAPAIETPS